MCYLTGIADGVAGMLDGPAAGSPAEDRGAGTAGAGAGADGAAGTGAGADGAGGAAAGDGAGGAEEGAAGTGASERIIPCPCFSISRSLSSADRRATAVPGLSSPASVKSAS